MLWDYVVYSIFKYPPVQLSILVSKNQKRGFFQSLKKKKKFKIKEKMGASSFHKIVLQNIKIEHF